MKHPYSPPIEYQVLNLLEIEHRTGWEQGKRENLMWAIETLRENGYPDAADYLEGICFGEAVLRVKQASRFQPGKHKESDKATEIKTPDTHVRWPGEKPAGGNAGNDKPK